jgi:hypothetical protein
MTIRILPGNPAAPTKLHRFALSVSLLETH